MDKERFKKIAQKEKYAEEASIKYRGEIIHAISQLESHINYFLSEHFCGRNDIKQMQFMGAIMGNRSANLMYKYEILLYVLSDSYPVTFAKHKKELTAFKKVIEFRNAIAHRQLDPLLGITEDSDEEFNLTYYTISEYEFISKKTRLSDKVIEEKKKAIYKIIQIVLFLKSENWKKQLKDN